MSPTATGVRPRTGSGTGGGDGGDGSGANGRRIDPRIARRRSAVTRQAGRRRLRVLVIGLVGTMVLIGLWFLAHSPLFSARAITVVGATHETAAEVIQSSGLAAHPALLDVDTSAVARGVDSLPWVRSASVHLSWPDGVRIVVHEEVPRLVMAVPGGRFAEIAPDGRVLALSATRPAGLLALGGPAAAGAVGSTLGAPDAVALAVAASLPPSFVGQVTGVTAEPGGWVQLALTTPIVIDVGNATQLSAKYEDISALLAGGSLEVGDVIDVSVPSAPTVTHA